MVPIWIDAHAPQLWGLQHRLSICRIAASFTIDPNDLFEPGRVEKKTGGSVRKVNKTAFKSWTETLSEQESWKKHCKHPSEQFRVPSNNSHLSLLCSPFSHKFCWLFERNPLLPLEQKPSPLGLSTNLLQKALQSLGVFSPTKIPPMVRALAVLYWWWYRWWFRNPAHQLIW